MFVDPNGKWPFYIHNRIYEAAFSGVLTQSQLQIIKTRSFWADFSSGAQAPENAYQHSMCSPGQSTATCGGAISRFIERGLSAAAELSRDGRELNEAALSAFALAIHASTDAGSPAHTAENGNPRVWTGGRREGAAHIFAERNEWTDWYGLGLSIRNAITGFAKAFPEVAKKQGNVDAWIERTIKNYVENRTRLSDPVIQDAARLCALGNRAACPD